MAPNVKKPRILKTPWPPTEDLLQAQPVTSFDNWTTLQAQFKRCDVWDIIYYNFGTYDTDEVNWYLHEWIGCTLPTGDGQNYRFGTLLDQPFPSMQIFTPGSSSYARPMQIYIPTDGWLPPGPQQAAARQVVLDILRDPIASGLHFAVGSPGGGSIELRPGDLLAVATAITSGKITVIHRPCMGWMAQYQSGSGRRLLSPFASAPQVWMKALVVHEGVHAAMQVAKIPMSMEHSEALAYITQALYARRQGIDLGTTTVTPGFFAAPRNFIAWKGIYQFAANIAEDIDNGKPVTDFNSLLEAVQKFFRGVRLEGGLETSIKLAPTYENEGPPINDGV